GRDAPAPRHRTALRRLSGFGSSIRGGACDRGTFPRSDRSTESVLPMTDRLDPPPAAAPGGPVGTWPWLANAPVPAGPPGSAAAPPEPGGDPPKAPTRRSRAATRLRRATPFLLGIVATFIALALYGALFPPKAPLSTADVTNTVNKVLASQ